MSEPNAKKAKLSNEDRETITFTKGNEACDRALLVDNVLFRVYSETMIEHSEYFRVMFTADFMEKDKNEILLIGAEVDEIQMFLSALFEPKKITVEEKDLPLLCKLFSFYRATRYFAEFLKEKDVFNQFPVRDLIELSVEHGIPEMKDKAEEVLVINFTQKFPVSSKKYDVPAKDFKFDDYITNSLKLVSEFGLLKLKEKVEARLASDYNRLKRHSLTTDDLYIKLMYKYNLEDLAKAMVPHVLSLLDKINNSKSTYVEGGIHTVLGLFLENDYNKKDGTVKLIKLKEGIENYYIDCVKDDKNIESVFRDLSRYGMSNLIKTVENILLNKLKSCEQDNVDLIKECCDKSGNMPRLKVAIEKFILGIFEKGGEIETKIIDNCQYHSKYHLKETGLKEAIENYLIKDFENNHSIKNIEFAFTEVSYPSEIYFLKFNATILDYLRTVTLDDPIMKAGYQHIMALRDQHKITVLETMLRNPDDEK